MACIHAILKFVQKQGAPYLHPAACSPPTTRIPGRITALRNGTRTAHREAA